MTRILLLICILCTGLLTGCGSQPSPAPQSTDEPQAITVSAAISMKEALEDIKTTYCNEKHISPDLIRFNYGGSGTLRQQIEQQAPVDIFISASQDHMTMLDKKGRIQVSQPFVRNSLVAIVSKNNKDIHDITDITTPLVGHIALGDPKTVPAGAYGKQVLEKNNTWETVKNKVVYAKDVRAVLTYVAQQSAELGFVYKTDVAEEPQVRIIAEIPEHAHDPIIYPIGLIRGANKSAQEFYTYLLSPEAMHIAAAHGFAPAEP